MGSYDCYCALCGGPLGNFAKWGSRKTKHRTKRHSRISLKKRRLAGEDVHEDGPRPRTSKIVPEERKSDEDDASPDTDMTEPSPFDDSDTGEMATWYPDENESMFSYYEQHSYDPYVLKKGDTTWLGRCRCLGFNPDAKGITKAFISGRGTYDDYGRFRVRESSDDPNAPDEEDGLPCFSSYDENALPAFPFHETCYELLARALFGEPDTTRIDKDVLYSIFTPLCDDYARSLDQVDYGGIEGIDQTWECIQGEEYSVCDPYSTAGVSQYLESILPASLLNHTESPDLSKKITYDPLTKLPYDILHILVQHLPPKDFLSLLRASWYVTKSTNDNAFWKSFLRRKIMSCFWEIEDLLDNVPEDFDFKRAFLWLNRLTTCRFGMEGYLMGIANRRRIWNVCQQIVPLYRKQVPENDLAGSQDEEARTILQSSASLYMPMVAFPRIKEARTVSTLFIRSWDDISKPCLFETFWNSETALVGIAVTFGIQTRLFGEKGVEGSIVHKYSVSIPENDWINEVVLQMQDVDMFGEPKDPSQYMTAMHVQPTAPVFIVGMKLTLTSGKSIDVKRSPPGCNQRPLIVAVGRHLVGLTGRIASSGIISHLGLLQSFFPGEDLLRDSDPDAEDGPSLLQAQKLLWKPESIEIPLNASSNTRLYPIWRHPTLSMSPFTIPSQHYDVPTEMLPHHALIWAHEASEYRFLRRISVFQPIGGYVSGGSKHDGSDWEAPYPDIVGLRAEYVPDYPCPPRTIGTGGPLPIQRPGWSQHRPDMNPDPKGQSWFEQCMTHFDIDGPGGEIVTEVHVADEAKAVTIRTNCGREIQFGEGRRHVNEWTRLKAEEGRVIVGLVVCFGSLSGWSWEKKARSHWKANTVTILTLPVDKS
ncbi:hypothetical protein BDV96DRAFT_567199 [Lophiotrema nucula]|uniref:F-box domain-containing protein n=1 Tax=Lophiotrema nucula TaxID=690887 RepID=A0A6A5ZK18_9PLEO|nr:hypothetical protein BDV96DRAFT_567199 [Lophiotrema nucula]